MDSAKWTHELSTAAAAAVALRVQRLPSGRVSLQPGGRRSRELALFEADGAWHEQALCTTVHYSSIYSVAGSHGIGFYMWF